MVRRRWQLIVLVICIIPIVGFAFQSMLGERVPFQFLSGQQPQPNTKEGTEVYYFEANGQHLVERAKAELLAEGFAVWVAPVHHQWEGFC